MLIDEGKRFTPDEILVCKMDFVPTGSLTKRVYKLIHGLKGFFAKIDQGMPEPEYLYGETNKKLASVASKLGFEATKLPVMKRDIEYRVVGRTQEVRNKFEEMLKKTDSRGRTIIEILDSRIQASKTSSRI